MAAEQQEGDAARNSARVERDTHRVELDAVRLELANAREAYRAHLAVLQHELEAARASRYRVGAIASEDAAAAPIQEPSAAAASASDRSANAATTPKHKEPTVAPAPIAPSVIQPLEGGAAQRSKSVAVVPPSPPKTNQAQPRPAVSPLRRQQPVQRLSGSLDLVVT